MSIPVLNLAQMREWEQATWATGQTEAEVIRRVGECIARHARQLTKPGDLILILAGKGHNGDDARAAREHLADRRVETLDVASPETALAKLEAVLPSRPALVIDGLFGIGLNRPLDEAWTRLIKQINQSNLRVLAVDVPSGLIVDTGEPATPDAAIEAAVTLTIGAPKEGLLRLAAWPFVGRLEVATDVGLTACPHESASRWTSPADFDAYPPRRPAAAHKGSFGHLAIVAGSLGYHGAAVLAARGAQRAQPGLITLFTQEAVYHAIAAQLQAVMVNMWPPALKLAGNFTALLIGPGLAAPDMPDEIKMATRRLWRDWPQPMIVDATALDWVPLDTVTKGGVRILTPHPGEAARFLKTTPQAVQADRPRALREISRRVGNCWVALKGHQTFIGRSTGEIFVNSSGNPHLAQGGSGDVLAGFIGGLLAQPALQSDPGKALRYAVWQHGAAADALQARRRNWVVEDLFNEIGNVRVGDQ
jgi:NAD(P)H-hydrate epimerase